MPKTNRTINWTPILKGYVARCGSKNWHQKRVCSEKIRLCAQNMLTILSSIVNMIGEDLYDH